MGGCTGGGERQEIKGGRFVQLMFMFSFIKIYMVQSYGTQIFLM
jgi:hypothetical protein